MFMCLPCAHSDCMSAWSNHRCGFAVLFRQNAVSITCCPLNCWHLYGRGLDLVQDGAGLISIWSEVKVSSTTWVYITRSSPEAMWPQQLQLEPRSIVRPGLKQVLNKNMKWVLTTFQISTIGGMEVTKEAIQVDSRNTFIQHFCCVQLCFTSSWERYIRFDLLLSALS